MKNILIVEDNKLNMKLFNDILKYQNYKTDTAIDGLEAYQKIKNNSYDLIILDIQLPKLDGFSLMEKLQKENMQIPPVIIASACAMDTDKLQAKKYGIDTYLTKPIDINNFINTVKSKIEI